LIFLREFKSFAGVAELADAPDLGSGGTPVQVQVLSPAPMSKEVDRYKVIDFFYFL
jgi:hypothetical protein